MQVMTAALAAACAVTCAALMAKMAGTVRAAGDMEAIESVIKTAYVDGVHAKGDAALMRQGFHPDFRMLVLKDGALTAVTLDEWAARVEKSARERKTPAPQIRHEFAIIDVTAQAAVARVEIFRDGTHVFTDYLSLYRFADGWKIVSKIFQTRT